MGVDFVRVDLVSLTLCIKHCHINNYIHTHESHSHLEAGDVRRPRVISSRGESLVAGASE